MNNLTVRYHDALERIATLDGIKGFEETDVMTASANLFMLVCKLKNIAKEALNLPQIDAPTVEVIQEKDEPKEIANE